MSEHEDAWVIKADLPTVEQSDISLLVTNQQLTITAPGKPEAGFAEGGFYRAERKLPMGVFWEQVRAQFREGVLEIRLPKGREPVRRVPIETAVTS